MNEVYAPIAGTVLPLASVPDPVFAEAMLGPGLAIDPQPIDGVVEVRAPVDGKVTNAMSHAIVLGSPSILVHLGIDTVHLKGAGFTTHVEVDDEVRRGDLLTTWQVGEAGELPLFVPVVALRRSEIEQRAFGAVRWGDHLFTVTA